jgi:hypothetical protein
MIAENDIDEAREEKIVAIYKRTLTFYIVIITTLIADVYYINVFPLAVMNIAVIAVVSYLFIQLIKDTRFFVEKG